MIVTRKSDGAALTVWNLQIAPDSTVSLISVCEDGGNQLVYEPGDIVGTIEVTLKLS